MDSQSGQVMPIIEQDHKQKWDTHRITQHIYIHNAFELTYTNVSANTYMHIMCGSTDLLSWEKNIRNDNRFERSLSCLMAFKTNPIKYKVDYPTHKYRYGLDIESPHKYLCIWLKLITPYNIILSCILLHSVDSSWWSHFKIRMSYQTAFGESRSRFEIFLNDSRVNWMHFEATLESLQYRSCMMTSSNGNIFRVTGHLCGEFTGPRWIPHTKASDAELWCLLWSAPG